MEDRRRTEIASGAGSASTQMAAGSDPSATGIDIRSSSARAPETAVGVGDESASMRSRIREKASTAAESGKQGLAARLEDVAQAARKSSQHLRGNQDWLAGAVDRGATELNSLAIRLRQSDLRSLASEVRSFARRQPALFAGIALAAGFAIARFGRIVANDLSRADLPSMPEMQDGRR